MPYYSNLSHLISGLGYRHALLLRLRPPAVCLFLHDRCRRSQKHRGGNWNSLRVLKLLQPQKPLARPICCKICKLCTGNRNKHRFVRVNLFRIFPNKRTFCCCCFCPENKAEDKTIQTGTSLMKHRLPPSLSTQLQSASGAGRPQRPSHLRHVNSCFIH